MLLEQSTAVARNRLPIDRLIRFVSQTVPQYITHLINPVKPLGPEEIYLSRKLMGDENIFRPRKDVPEWKYGLPIDWRADPFGDKNWRFTLHAWRMTDPVLERYFDLGDTKALDFAARVALDWWQWHRAAETDFSWSDMATGIRALRIAFLLNAVKRREIKSRYRPALMEMAQEHAKRLQVEEFIVSGNHGLFQVFGLALLCKVADLPGIEFATEKFRWVLSHQFTDEGVHKENSPTYHRFALNVLRRLEAAERFDSPEITDFIQRAEQIEPWVILPNARWVNIGDSFGPSGKPAELKGGTRHDIGGQNYAVSDFSKSGYSIVRSADPQGSSMLFMTGMSHTYVHKHADELSFELFEHGRLIFVDSGKYGYTSNDMRNYVESAAAHNTISLLDQEIGRKSVRAKAAKLNKTEVADGRFILSGEVERKGLFRQERRIEYRPSEWMTIEDVISGPDASYVSSLHLAPDLEPVPTESGFSVSVKGRTVTAEIVSHGCRLEFVRGRSSPSPLGWVTSGYLEMSPATVVRAIHEGENPHIKWRISLA